MNDVSETRVVQKSLSLSRRRLSVYAILALSFVAAAAVRLYNIKSPQLEFYPTRQYESYCIARSFYFESIDSVPDCASEGKGPPLTEYLVSLVYRASGGERDWAPHLLCSVFWLIGGVFVFATAKKFTPSAAAAIATAFYLLVPFGIFMTRSFQPESLMIMMFTASIYTIFNYYEKESTKRLLIMAAISGLAILAKATVIFPIWTAFIVTGICKNGFRKAVFSLHHLVFELVGIMPGLVYYLYLILFAPKLGMVAESVYGPQLLLGSYFWVGWLSQLGDVTGFIPLVGAIIGVILVRDKLARSMLIGLALGYFVYGLIFAADAPTQGYKQLHVMCIVALAMSPVIAFFLNQLRQKDSRFRRPTIIVGLLLVVVLFVLLVSIKVSAFRSENKYIKPSLSFAYKCFGLVPKYMSKVSTDYADFIYRAKEIGRAVNHSDKTITLGLTQPLWYYGQYAGHRWPANRHWPFPDAIRSIGTGAKWRKYRGLSAEELFERHFLKFCPEYFIVVALEDFEKQKSLKEFLYGKFEILVQEDKYLIFDMTEPKE